MADIVITGRDYANFNTTFSDLNIIRGANGGEYFIDGASSVAFTIQPNNIVNENGEIFPEQHFVDGAPTEFGGFIAGSEKHDTIYNVQNRTYRKELGYISGEVIAHTSDVIYDINSISVDVAVEYDTYQASNTQFSGPIIYYDNAYANTFVYSLIYDSQNLKQNESNVQVENSLPNKPAKISVYDLHNVINGSTNREYNLDNKQRISRPQILSVSDEGTTIKFTFKLLVWSGFNEVSVYLVPTINNLLLNVAKKITLSINANTITTEENEFSYLSENSQSFNTDEPYELERNELFQYTKEQPIEERLSYAVANKIFDKTNINRQIVSFDLLKIKKYGFVDGAGNTTVRYLQSRDKIKIKDEKGQWLGAYNDASGNEVVPDFEVVKCENKWNGKFYKHIVCKQAID